MNMKAVPCCVGFSIKSSLSDGWMLSKTLAASYSPVLELSHTSSLSLTTSP